MSRVSETLLKGTENEVEVTGEPLAVFGSHLFTVAIHVANLTGRVHIEASLAAEPGEDDWFPVAAVEFPRPGALKREVVARTFKGSFSYLRARLARPGLSPGSNQGGNYGAVDKVLLNR